MMQTDSRVTYADICGVRYPMCLTVAAQDQIREGFGGIAQMAKAVEADSDAASDVTIKLIHILMRGGAARVSALAKMSGEETDTPAVPDKDVLRDILTIGELAKLQAAAFTALRVSSAQTVEVGEDRKRKNAETTQG